jgi:hypothetical protein
VSKCYPGTSSVMSLVSSDISPNVATQRQRQGNVLVVRINGSIPCNGGERAKHMWGKPSPITMSCFLAKSAIGNKTQWAQANGPIRSGLGQGGVRNKFHFATLSLKLVDLQMNIWNGNQFGEIVGVEHSINTRGDPMRQLPVSSRTTCARSRTNGG